jgi:hypothetical protein
MCIHVIYPRVYVLLLLSHLSHLEREKTNPINDLHEVGYPLGLHFAHFALGLLIASSKVRCLLPGDAQRREWRLA